MHDVLCNSLITDNPNLMIPWFLMASYAYEVCDASIISDGMYDRLSTEMFKNFPSLTHRHKGLIEYAPGQTKGSSLCVNMRKVPLIVRDAAHNLMN